jgi:hypothetical protein
MATKLDIAEDNFKLFTQIWNKVENIGKIQTEQLEISENLPNSDYRNYINKHDLDCNCYLCKDLGELKLRYNQKGVDASK